MNRCIFHVDMDAFFASIEIAQNPFLKGKPVIVGGHPESRGVVSTCSYEARAFGVRSAMPLSKAYRLCPHGIFLEGNYSLYKTYSRKIVELFYALTPYVEVVSIDEAYLDVSCLPGVSAPRQLAASLKEKILKETGLTCSIGIAVNKLVAKIAASQSKPNGLLEIPQGTEAEFLSPLPIQAIPGIGEKTQQTLNREGIRTISDLQALSLDELIRAYGAWGYHYYHSVRGKDNRPVHWEEENPKSLGAETTFEVDQSDLELLSQELRILFEKAYHRLRRHKMRAKRVSIKLRYSDFTTITRSSTLISHSNDATILEAASIELLHKNYQGMPPLRLIGVTLEQLTDGYWQPTFWDLPENVSLPDQQFRT